MANEFIIKNGFRSRGNSQITGSLSATSFIGDGSGLNSVSAPPPAGTVSSSAQIASDISGSFVAPSASFSSRVTTNETNITTLTANTGSYAVTDEFAQFSSVQAGQLTATSRVNTDNFRVATAAEFTFIGGGINVGGNVTSSAGILATGTVLGSNLSGTNTGDQDLSSYALTAAISGAFTAPSSSFSTRVTTLEGNPVFSSAGISGSFTAPSSSFSSRTTALENKTIYSGSFSGSFQGDGSALTGVSVFPFTGDAQITGSLKISGSIDYEIPDSQFKSYKVPGYYRKAFANNAGDAVQYVDDYIEIHFNDAGTDDIEMTIMRDPAEGEVHVTINNEGTYTYLDRKRADSRFDLNSSFGNDEFNQVDVRAPFDITWPWYRITFINANSTSGNFITMLIEKFI